ncbi:MAG: hypothetical protein ACTSXP_16120 [Promethearchaeota archaeon]
MTNACHAATLVDSAQRVATASWVLLQAMVDVLLVPGSVLLI